LTFVCREAPCVLRRLPNAPLGVTADRASGKRSLGTMPVRHTAEAVTQSMPDRDIDGLFTNERTV